MLALNINNLIIYSTNAIGINRELHLIKNYLQQVKRTSFNAVLS
jgi:hypothetical protein